MNFNVETPENYEQKCLCVLVLDVSSSMAGEPINELNKGIQSFYKDIASDSTTANRLEVCIIEFATNFRVLIEPSLVDNFTMPALKAKGSTAMADGIRQAIEKVEERKNWYKTTKQKYYRPWIILFTDGEPDSNQDMAGLTQELKAGFDNKNFFFFAIGVQGANMKTLEKISSPSMPPAMLEGLKFSSFFKWLSASMTTITASKFEEDGESVVTLPNPAAWMTGFKI